jgi:asparagine synthase (glutamine-hydrolysing)
MCGIGGIARWDGSPPSPEAVRRLLNAQRHRGPDACASWADEQVSLAHNRLSIIDLATGDQPMRSADGRYAIVYNGELYNFHELRKELERQDVVFRTASDTEVVMYAYARWGAACLPRLRGMYAFAIWDTAARELFVTRDRLGIKPLFYWQASSGFAFASELQGLLSVPEVGRGLDLGALDLYLHYQYVPPPLTIYADVRKLEPGCSLLVSASTPLATPQRYWSLKFEPDRSKSEHEWLEAMGEVIDDSVRAHLVSDVPFGAFLSGGVDSSVVAAHMQRHLAQPLQTFTIGFDEAAYDERCYAADVAQHLGAAHHEEVVHVDKYDLLDDLLPKLARHYGEPFADSSAIPTFAVSAIAGARVKMVLSGDGGDELFAGYNTYPAILEAVARNGSRSWRQRLRHWLPVRDSALRRVALSPKTTAALEQHGLYYAHFADERRRQLYRTEIADSVQRNDRHSLIRDWYGEAGLVDGLSALQYLDLHTYLPGDILTKVDIAAMAHSLEVRVPLLDHRVVEFAASIPAEFKMFAPDGSLSQKYLLKKYANRLLPGDAFNRRKQGFGVPIDRWFRDDLYDQVRRRLLVEPGILDRLFNPTAREALVASPAAAYANAPRIWSLLFLRAWAAGSGVTL